MPERRVLTPELGAQLIFHSFAPSQGEAGLQTVFYDYLHYKYSYWQVSDELKDQIQNETLKLVKSYFAKASKAQRFHQPEDSQDVEVQIETQVEDFQQYLNERQSTRVSHLYQEVLTETIKRDHKFLTRPYGRGDHADDPWKSYFRELLLNPNPPIFIEYKGLILGAQNYWRVTNHAEKICRKVTDPNDKQCKTLGNQLNHVALIWEQNHLGQHFAPTPLPSYSLF